MKKKILFVSHALELGGAERSLIGLLDAIDPQQYDVDLFLLRHEGELMAAIPKHVHLLPQVPAYTVLARPMKETLLEGHILLTGARLAGKLAARRVAISFLTPHYFVAKKVNAKKKIAWIHTDYSKVQVDIPSETAMWGAYDHIASISNAVTDSFIKVFPSLKEKVVLIQNILPERLVRQQANAFSAEAEMPEDGSIRLLSIGRFCTAKNFDNVPDICAKLLYMGLDVKWYIVGFGGDEALIRQKIADSHMEAHVILLGKKENPYPYIKACDLYVQPSRYEGNCVTVREAQLLGKPVVITRYATSASQLEDGADGVIVPMDNAGCAAVLRMERLSQTCKSRDYSNRQEVEKLYQIVG